MSALDRVRRALFLAASLCLLAACSGAAITVMRFGVPA